MNASLHTASTLPSPATRAAFDRFENDLLRHGAELVEVVVINSRGEFEAIRFPDDWDKWMTSDAGKAWHSLTVPADYLEPSPLEAQPRDDGDASEWWQR